MELSPKALEDPEGPVWTLEEALWSLYLGQPPVLLKEPQPYSGWEQELGPLLPGALPTSTCSPAGWWKAQHDGLFLQGLGYQRPLQWATKPSGLFFSVLPPWCPFFDQMFLISQEVRQGLI